MPDEQIPKFTVPGWSDYMISQGRVRTFKIDPNNTTVIAGQVDVPGAGIDPQTTFFSGGSFNGYSAISQFNVGTGGTVAADFVAFVGTLPAGVPGTYVDLGINGPQWNDTATYAILDANAGYCYANSGNFYVGAGGSGTLSLFAGGYTSKGKQAVIIDPNQNIAMGTGAVGSAATDGFMYIRGGTGVPTATPTAKTGLFPLYFNTTTSVLYIYNGAWKAGTFA